MERTESRADVVKYRIVSPMKTRSIMPRDVVESGEEDVIPPTQLITSNTPHFNPHKCLKTPQSEECSKRERPSQFERQKRKGYSPCKASPQKVPKKYNSDCFAELANAFTEADNEIMKLKNKIDAYE
ncbi:uncharacterized protein LOC113464403 [Ceratina calcarata]|uniref:Uncharacterized protein LOC113464403 n=1 Tax=Ceratina calcarata TaxID=156304 RepID=A0AAJ7S2U6_9HYME|nr:uncharacterized protein LOC113464403 [Ceratina calcarata]